MVYLILLVSLFFRHQETGFFKALQKYFKIAFCQPPKLPNRKSTSKQMVIMGMVALVWMWRQIALN
jgi:hypothetical protein